MTKLEMAHEFAMKLAELKVTNKTEDIIRLGWEYADAMQAEADKREQEASEKSRKEMEVIIGNHEHIFVGGRICWCGKTK